MEKIIVDKNIIQDAVNIKNGVYAPLSGFLYPAELKSVLTDMRLPGGAVWSIPIIASISRDGWARLKGEEKVELVAAGGEGRAVLAEIVAYPYNKKELAEVVFGTLDEKHPGVAELMANGDYLLAGRVVSAEQKKEVFSEYCLTPPAAKKIFRYRGWQTVAAFQTRNVPHRGHEFLQKRALAEADGLFIQPVIGEKKLEDFKDEYIISAYEILLEKYYPPNKAVLGVLPLKMRYAGPREAVMHALIRRNFGCTHFIVGRDHAGVGDYYHPTAAQEIFGRFDQSEIGVKVLKYPEVVYNKTKGEHCFAPECKKEDEIGFSGTELRAKIRNRQRPPAYLVRPEIYNLLTNSHNVLVDSMYKKSNHNFPGFVLWFTGLSAAGKSVIADRVYGILATRGMRVERLDGDIVRENFTRDLGFSARDRDENIRRIGFIGRLLAKNGIGVLASFISPYRRQRDELRMKIPNFIEVFVDAPLSVCEQRDRKGLYRKARAGEIKNFTGISDPYEPPSAPEIHLRTDKMDIGECAAQVLEYLKKKGLTAKNNFEF